MLDLVLECEELPKAPERADFEDGEGVLAERDVAAIAQTSNDPLHLVRVQFSPAR